MSIPQPTQSTDDYIAQLKVTTEGYLAALVADSTNPQPSYSFEGESCDRDTWRQHLRDQIKANQELICLFQPYEITTVQM